MTFVLDILPPKEIYERAVRMQAFLEKKPVDHDEGLIDRLELIEILVAQSGKLLADSKYWLDQRKNDSITQTLKDALSDKWSVSIINKKIDALCKDENYLVTLVDRINASATHQIDALRTIISYRKTQMAV